MVTGDSEDFRQLKKRKLILLLLIMCVALAAGACKGAVPEDSSTGDTGAEIQLSKGDSYMGFDEFDKVNITGIDIASLDEDQKEILYQQARYCQAMADADTDTLRELVSEDKTFTHMSGKTQTRDEYFADIENGRLDYHTDGIENLTIEVKGDSASITYTSVLNANAYGASGTFRMKGTRDLKKVAGVWKEVN